MLTRLGSPEADANSSEYKMFIRNPHFWKGKGEVRGEEEEVVQ